MGICASQSGASARPNSRSKESESLNDAQNGSNSIGKQSGTNLEGLGKPPLCAHEGTDVFVTITTKGVQRLLIHNAFH
jgi:hypothetical protein